MQPSLASIFKPVEKRFVFAIFQHSGFGRDRVSTPIYVGFSSRKDLSIPKSEFKQMVKKGGAHNSSKKMQTARVNLNEITIRFLAVATPANVNDMVNKYIIKFDTINSGLNSILR